MKWKIKGDYLVIRIPLRDMSHAILEAETAEWNKAGELPKPRVTTAELQRKIAELQAEAALDEDDEPLDPEPIEHTKECMILRAQEEQFAREWPVHCRTCRAAGYIGVANGQKKSCPRCIEFHLCPRCGNSALTKMTTEEGTFFNCPGCEWNQAAALSPRAEALGLQSPRWFCLCEKEKAHA